MTKGFKYGALSIIASALLSTSAFGITLTDNSGQAIGTITGNTAQTKASELSTSAAIANINLGNYVPHGIDLTTLSNPTFNYAVEHGTLTLTTPGALFYYVVEVAPTTTFSTITNKVVAKYTAGSGTSTIAFGATGPQVSNGNVYVIVQGSVDFAIVGTTTVNDIGAVTQNGVTYTQTGAATADRVVVNLGQGDSQTVSDVAVATILTASKQLCGNIIGVQKNIDPTDGFKSFNLQGAVCGANTQDLQDTIRMTIHANNFDIDAVTAGTDTATAVIRSSIPLPAGTTASIAGTPMNTIDGVSYYDMDAAAATVTPCGIVNSATDSTVTCTIPGVDLTQNFGTANGDDQYMATVTLAVSGTVAIARTSFVADVEYNFANAGATDYNAANKLVANLNANTWNYNGANITVPSVNQNADTNTQVKINNNSTQAARVFWTLTDDAGNVATMIEVASAAGNTGLAAGKSDTWLATALRAAAPTIGQKFRAEAVVTATESVDAVTVMMINGGRDRVIPTSIDNANGADFVR